MYNPTLRSRAGFTLIELLTVIAIIGILAAILFPAIGAARTAAQKSRDLANIRSIGQAALVYASQNNGRLPNPAATNSFGANTYYTWFALLAQAGNLSDPSILYSNVDSKEPDPLPTRIITTDNNGAPAIDPGFTATNPSYEVIGAVKDTDPGTTPIAFTRGLTSAGTWDPASGTYGTGGGGLIVFTGGNVVQYPKMIGTPSSLVDLKGAATTDIKSTIPATRFIYGPASGAIIGIATTGTAGTGTVN